MTWRYSKAHKEIERPDSVRGFHVEGPLTADDWRAIAGDIMVEMVDQAKRETAAGGDDPRPSEKRRFRA
jgi:hypothetical protein